jgi:hypothetical protein
MQQAERRIVKAGQEMVRQQADKWTLKAGQEIYHASGRQMDRKDRAGDRSSNRSTDGQ